MEPNRCHLAQCALETIHTDRRGYELLTDKHVVIHKKRGTNPTEYRPDIVHQCLLHLQESPLNRAGMLEVFIHTHKGVLISVDPRCRIPMHFRHFNRLFSNLLFRLKVRSSSGYVTLLKVIKNPITDHLPPNAKFIRLEVDEEVVSASALPAKYMSRGKPLSDKISNTERSASFCHWWIF